MYRFQRITITAMLLSTASMVGAFAGNSTAISCDFSTHKTEGECGTATTSQNEQNSAEAAVLVTDQLVSIR